VIRFVRVHITAGKSAGRGEDKYFVLLASADSLDP